MGINKRSAQKINSKLLVNNRAIDWSVLPDFAEYCFCNITGTIKSAFGITNNLGLPTEVLPDSSCFDQVLLILIDGLGWQALHEHQDSDFYKLFDANGVVSRLTSQFPSTTAAHLTSLACGLPVAETGIFEWYYYESKLDQVIVPLQFRPARNKLAESLGLENISGADIFPSPHFFNEINSAGIRTIAALKKNYATSSYSSHMFGGSQVIPYSSISQAMRCINSALHEDRPALAYLYIDSVDSTTHCYGPSTSRTNKCIRKVLKDLNRAILSLQRNKKLLVLVTADHGHISVSPSTTLYVNKLLPNIESMLRANKKEERIQFAGSPRDLFLYAVDNRKAELMEQLSRCLAEKALVLDIETVAPQLFGNQMSQRLLDRLGNILILPLPGESVFWYEAGLFEQKFLGHHGGLSAAEMYIPFLSAVI